MMGIVSEYTAATAPGPIARLPPDIFPISSQHQYNQQQQQTMLDSYSLVEDDDCSMQQYDEEQDIEQGQYTQFDSDPDNSTNSYTIQKSMSTQTSKKIKPVKRPGLVLKTPIAYQPCLDPSVIPIQRDGMGTFILFIFVLFSFTAIILFLIFNISNTQILYFESMSS